MKKLFLSFILLTSCSLYPQEISLDEYARTWHDTYVASLNDTDKTLLANTLYLSAITSAIDINVKRLIHIMLTNVLVIKNAVVQNDEQYQHALEYLQKDAPTLNTLVNGHTVAMKTWQHAMTWIDQNGSSELHTALNMAQQQLQHTIQAFIQANKDNIEQAYTTGRDVAHGSQQLSHQVQGLYQALLNNENPVHHDDTALQPIIDIDTATKVSAATEQQAYRDMQASQGIENITLMLQEISHIFYQRLYDMLLQTPTAPSMVKMFNSQGLIPADQQTTLLEPLE